MMREEALEVVQFDALDQINLLIDNDMNSVSETGLHDSKEKKIECPICGITADADCTIMQPSKGVKRKLSYENIFETIETDILSSLN